MDDRVRRNDPDEHRQLGAVDLILHRESAVEARIPQKFAHRIGIARRDAMVGREPCQLRHTRRALNIGRGRLRELRQHLFAVLQLDHERHADEVSALPQDALLRRQTRRARADVNELGLARAFLGEEAVGAEEAGHFIGVHDHRGLLVQARAIDAVGQLHEPVIGAPIGLVLGVKVEIIGGIDLDGVIVEVDLPALLMAGLFALDLRLIGGQHAAVGHLAGDKRRSGGKRDQQRHNGHDSRGRQQIPSHGSSEFVGHPDRSG